MPLYLAVVGREGGPEQRRIARRATLISFVVLVAFVVVGQIMLNAMGIAMDSFRIAGGVVLLLIGLKMVLEDRRHAEPGAERVPGRDVAVFPLAMPFIAGPGAIMTVVLLTDNDQFSVLEQAETVVLLVLVLVLAFTYAAMRSAQQVHGWIGDTGVNIVTRVMGLILTAMAVESILAGIRGHFAKVAS